MDKRLSVLNGPEGPKIVVNPSVDEVWDIPVAELEEKALEAENAFNDYFFNTLTKKFFEQYPNYDGSDPDQRKLMKDFTRSDPQYQHLNSIVNRYHSLIRGNLDDEAKAKLKENTYFDPKTQTSVIGAVSGDIESGRRGRNRRLSSQVPQGTTVVTGHAISDEMPGRGSSGIMLDMSHPKYDSLSLVQAYKYAAEQPGKCVLGAHCSSAGMSDDLAEQLSTLAVKKNKAIIYPSGFSDQGDVGGSGTRNVEMSSQRPLGSIRDARGGSASITVFFPFGARTYKFNKDKVDYAQALKEIYSSPEFLKFNALDNNPQNQQSN